MKCRPVTRLFFILFALTLSIKASANAPSDPTEKVPLADLQRFTSVVEHIKNFYIKTIDDPTLFENAIRGMLAGLDPHSSYLDTDEFNDLKISTTGKFGGLGIELEMQDGFIHVISPIDDTPAQRAGIQAGDLIIRLNDTPIKGLTHREAIGMMRGERGTPITLTILRQGETKPLQIKVIRDIIVVQSVRSRMLEPGFGYIRISQFQNNSGEDLLRAVQNLKKASNQKLQGLVLDLRNNPGGLLEASIQVADAFLDKAKLKYQGLIVYTQGRLAAAQIKEKAHGGDVLQGAPIVILVNGGSASCSEIVAGALQDHHRAVIVGTKTFGKGSVQTIFPLKDRRGLRLTTALYYTPAGRSIQATGITPDIIVPALKIPLPNENEQNALLLREKDLQGHLESVQENTKASTQKKDSMNLLTTDYQLYEGLNILKGLTLLRADAA